MSNYCQYSSRYDLLLKGEVPIIFNPEYGGGCLMDIKFYIVYMNVALFGKPEKYVYYPNIFKNLADTSGIMVMQYDGFVTVPPAFLPNMEILKRELPKIGKIRLVMSNYSQYSSRYDLRLKGEVPNIFKNLADTSGIMVMQYDGFVSEAAGAKDTWGTNYIQIEGEKGYIYVKGGSNALSEIKVVTKEKEEVFNEQTSDNRWLMEIQNMTKLEKGYIYVKGGSNALSEIKVVTKEKEEVFNEQTSDNRWLMEIQNMTKLLLAEDRDILKERLSVMEDVMEVLENARKAAGIFFPGD